MQPTSSSRFTRSAQGKDGFVSIEVSPLLAMDTAATVKEAKRLHAKLNRPNVLIKVPATSEDIRLHLKS